MKPCFSRLLKNKHQAVSQGAQRFGKRSTLMVCEHFQKPRNAGSRTQAQSCNNLLDPIAPAKK
jgi:hypothetical protein